MAVLKARLLWTKDASYVLSDALFFGVGIQVVCKSVIRPVKVNGGSILCLLISTRSEAIPYSDSARHYPRQLQALQTCTFALVCVDILYNHRWRIIHSCKCSCFTSFLDVVQLVFTG